MRLPPLLAGLLAAMTLGACGTRQVTPVYMQEEKRVCIIENPRVRFDFLGAYRRALEAKGYVVEVYPETAMSTICPVSTRYTGNYRWDLVMYLAYAEIRVYKDGRDAGRAVFNARHSRLGAETRINELVDELFKR